MKYFSMFSGIGGFEYGIESAFQHRQRSRMSQCVLPNRNSTDSSGKSRKDNNDTGGEYGIEEAYKNRGVTDNYKETAVRNTKGDKSVSQGLQEQDDSGNNRDVGTTEDSDGALLQNGQFKSDTKSRDMEETKKNIEHGQQVRQTSDGVLRERNGIRNDQKSVFREGGESNNRSRTNSSCDGNKGGEYGIEEANKTKPENSTLCEGRTPQHSGRPLCIGFSEVDKYASAIYEYHFPDHVWRGDATGIIPDELPDFDLLCGGFPCQSFSIAGKRGGFEDTRGTLFFEIARIVRVKRPQLLLLENVKGLLSHDNGRTFATILATLSELGYFCEWQVLNSKDYGVPQNRERVFIIGHLGGSSGREVFPIREGGEWINESDGKTTQTNISPTIDSRTGANPHWDTYVSCGTWRTHKDGEGFREVKEGICPTIPARAREDGSGQPVIKVNSITDMSQTRGGLEEPRVYKDICPCISSRDYKEPRIVNNIRRLTPIECERLQGFPDDWTKYGIIDGKKTKISDTQRYKCAGNAVTTNVITAIMRQINDTRTD